MCLDQPKMTVLYSKALVYHGDGQHHGHRSYRFHERMSGYGYEDDMEDIHRSRRIVSLLWDHGGVSSPCGAIRAGG